MKDDRLGSDGLYYLRCGKCGYLVANGPQDLRCPHYRVEPWDGSYWGNGKLPDDWKPEFGAAWLEEEVKDGAKLSEFCNCSMETILIKGCQCGGK